MPRWPAVLSMSATVRRRRLAAGVIPDLVGVAACGRTKLLRRGSVLAASIGRQASQNIPDGIFGASRAVVPPRVREAVWVYLPRGRYRRAPADAGGVRTLAHGVLPVRKGSRTGSAALCYEGLTYRKRGVTRASTHTYLSNKPIY
jgi:hypothetical protein